MWDMTIKLPWCFKLPMEKLLGCYFQVWCPYHRPDLGALKKCQDLKTTQPKELSYYTWGFEESCKNPRHFLAIFNCKIGLRITKIISITDISFWNVDWKDIKSCEPQTWGIIVWAKQPNFWRFNKISRLT